MNTIMFAGNYFRALALLVLCATQSAGVLVAQPMPEIQVPSFPDRMVNIKDQGAVGDGLTMNTEIINSAIQACAKAGGGTVLIPPGTWLTGPIRLESNINLHLEKGALVQFSMNFKDYPFIESSEGKQIRFRRAQLISAYQARNIAITGSSMEPEKSGVMYSRRT